MQLASPQRGIGNPLLIFVVALVLGLAVTSYVRSYRGEGRSSTLPPPKVAPLAGDLSEQAANRPLAMATVQVVAHVQYDVLLEFVPVAGGGPPRPALIHAAKGTVLELAPGAYDVVITYLRPGTSARVGSGALPLLIASHGSPPTLDLNQERVSRLPFRVGEGAPTR